LGDFVSAFTFVKSVKLISNLDFLGLDSFVISDFELSLSPDFCVPLASTNKSGIEKRKYQCIMRAKLTFI